VEAEDVGAKPDPAGGSHDPAVPAGARYSGSLRRLLVRGLLLGVLAGAVARLVRGDEAAVGAAAGCLAAGVYAWGYLRSHMARAGRSRIFDPSLARNSIVRITLLAAAGVGMRILGKDPFVGYLGGFAVAFAVLVALEAPGVVRQLRANGLMG